MISMLLRRTFGVLSFARAPLLDAARCPFAGSHLSPANSTNRGYKAEFIVCQQLNFSTEHRAQSYWFLTDHAQSVLSFALKPLLLNKLATSIFFPPYLLRRHMATSGKVDLNSPSTSWKEAKSYLKGLNNKKRREHYGIKDFIKLKDIPTWKDAAKKWNVKQPEEVKYPKNKDLNEKISLFRGDITKLEVDAIVNTASVGNVHTWERVGSGYPELAGRSQDCPLMLVGRREHLNGNTFVEICDEVPKYISKIHNSDWRI